MNRKQKKNLIRIIIAAGLFVLLIVLGRYVDFEALKAGSFPLGRVLLFALYLVPYLIVGADILKKAFKGILNRQVFDENFLMMIATVGALVLGLVKNGDFTEAVAVMLFYQVGELFQSIAVGKSRRNITQLMDIRPDYANIDENGTFKQVDPEEVAIGTVIIVKPGEKIPIDGIVTEGAGTLDTSALTGESIPRPCKRGDEVLSGCINMSGLLHIRTTREFGESTVSKILDLVENAGSRKSKSENFISKFARYYTPVVCFSALALAVLPPLVSLIAGIDPNVGEWIYRALTFLVISCPCALVISIPLTFFAGIGGAGNQGILVKGSNYLEALAESSYVVFDKTGTMTCGVFEVTDIQTEDGMEREELLRYAAHAECFSTHPISKSLLDAYGKEADRSVVTDVEELGGRGIKARVQGHEVACGNRKLMQDLKLNPSEVEEAGSIVHVAVDGRYAGHIRISDIVKPTAAEAIRRLHKAGIKKTVMLTGDRARNAELTARELGVDEVFSELLPEDKVERVERLIGEMGGRGRLAFVGDGINDAPVLSRADIGIAMGAMGSDAAIEAADIVLMDDNPLKIVKAIRISRKCLRIVKENTVFAICVKLLCLVLGALGIANMWVAIFADVGVMILAVLNAIRALFVKKL